MEGLVKIDYKEAFKMLMDKKVADEVYFYAKQEGGFKKVTDYRWVFNSGSAWNQLDNVVLYKVADKI